MYTYKSSAPEEILNNQTLSFGQVAHFSLRRKCFYKHPTMAKVCAVLLCFVVVLLPEISPVPLFGEDCPTLQCPDANNFTAECRKTGLFVTPDGKMCKGCDVCIRDEASQYGCPVMSCPPLNTYSARCTVLQYFMNGFFLCPACLATIC